MDSFTLYFRMGLEHITDLNGYDHMLFLLGMTAVWQLREWRRVLILVTAFTLGHSATLALAAFGLVRVNAAFIEFLIPVTILLTALLNFRPRPRPRPYGAGGMQARYGLVLFFGLIHGLGFSNYLLALLGRSQDILLPLFSFNLGLEAGQIAVVLLILLISYFIVSILRAPLRIWSAVISGFVAGLALWMIFDRI